MLGKMCGLLPFTLLANATLKINDEWCN